MSSQSEFATSESAAVLEPTGVHPRRLGEAMKQVTAVLSNEGSKPSRVYGVVVYGKSQKAVRPDYLATTGIFFRAYLRGVQALSRITHMIVSHPEEDHIRSLQTKDFEDVRVFLGKAAPTDIKREMQPSPGIYIIFSHLDVELLKELDLPLLPESLREVPLVIQVKDPHWSKEVKETATTWDWWKKSFAELGDDNETTIRKDTLKWRKWFMSKYEFWTSAEVAKESTSLATNRSAIASRWVAEKKIFAIEFEGQKWFPQFQFRDGRPIPAVSQVIEAFPEHATGWDLAFFFVTPNLNIGGRKPFELLKEDPSRVVSLAQAFAHPADVF